MFTLMYAWTNRWTNSVITDDLGPHDAWGPRIYSLPEMYHSRTPCSYVSNKGSPRPVLEDRVSKISSCTFTRCKHTDFFLYHMSVKYIQVIISDVFVFFATMFRTGCYAKQTKNPAPVAHILEQRWILVLLPIFVDVWTVIFRVPSEFQTDSGVEFEEEKQSSIKKIAFHNKLHNKFGLYIFILALVWSWYISSFYCAKCEMHAGSIYDVVTIPINVFPRYSTGWSVAKLSWWVSASYNLQDVFALAVEKEKTF